MFEALGTGDTKTVGPLVKRTLQNWKKKKKSLHEVECNNKIKDSFF